jgi:chemotaxis family two-component system sensor kinase Cph1
VEFEMQCKQFREVVRAGRTMQASFQDFKSLVEHSSDAISLMSADGEILYASASTTKVFGYQPEELVGRSGYDLFHPGDRDHLLQTLQEVLSEPPRSFQWCVRVRRKDESYTWVESTFSNLPVGPVMHAILVNYRDVNARRAEEVQRQEHAEKLARAKLELEEFAYSLAHDLRDPLSTISGFTEVLARKKHLDREGREVAALIMDGTARMSRLIDDLLSFASAGADKPRQRVELRGAVSLAVQNLGQAIKESGAVIKVGSLPAVLGHQGQLVRLFQNLIGNAIKYSRGESIHVHVTAKRSGPEWIIRIADDGMGIALENQQRVFVPFVRCSSQQVAGSGLGLAVCKKIVENLGGKIWVESELGVGSIFSFTISPAKERALVPMIEAGPMSRREQTGLAGIDLSERQSDFSRTDHFAD